MTFDLPQRFWDKVRKGAPNECWEWIGGRHGKCYGQFRYEGRVHKVPRLVLRSLGHDMTDLLAMHSCDNPPCCNPNHLSPGTHQENQADSVRKGRRNGLVGDRATFKKLTEARVRRLREEFDALPATGKYKADGASKQLAAGYGITYENMMMIVRRKTWRHI